jgi:hypothetical protein
MFSVTSIPIEVVAVHTATLALGLCTILARRMALDVVDSPRQLVVVVDKIQHLAMDIRKALCNVAGSKLAGWRYCEPHLRLFSALSEFVGAEVR